MRTDQNQSKALRANRLAVEFEGYADAHDAIPTRSESVYAIEKVEGDLPVRHEITTPKLRDAAVLLRERSTGLTLAAEQETALWGAINALPFSGAIMNMRTQGVDDAIEALKTLAGVLRAHVADVEQMRRELRELQSQRDAVRAFLGIDAIGGDL